MSSRSVRYHDPLDLIWLEAARRLGMAVVRSPEVYASWDGQSVLTIGTPETLDGDDCLAQIILHEFCHALVEGPGGTGRPDWGLENVDDRHAAREHACLRLQAALARRHGLRAFLAATTDYRGYYDALPEDPLARGADPAIEPARDGFWRAGEPPWREILETALAATARLAGIVRCFAPVDSLWARAGGDRPDPGERDPGPDSGSLTTD